MLHAFNEDGEIDYSKLRLSQGNLLDAQDATVNPHADGLLFTWNKQEDEDYTRAWDQVMLMANRSYHTWIAFIADDRESI